jgi:metal-responsive CopG/Arc/MetJ family transcriptional regulator
MQYNEIRGEASMHDQVTVRLPEDLSRALKAASRRMQRRSSEIVRLALREFLGPSSGRERRPSDRVKGLLGSLDSGVPDLAERHREHIIESLRRGR